MRNNFKVEASVLYQLARDGDEWQPRAFKRNRDIAIEWATEFHMTELEHPVLPGATILVTPDIVFM